MVGDLFKTSDEIKVNNKYKSGEPIQGVNSAETKDLSKPGNLSEASDLTETNTPSSSESLAEVGDLMVEVSDLTPDQAGRSVGRSGRTLPKGLIQPGNPYETWSSYRGRLEGDRRQRLRRQRRAAGPRPHSAPETLPDVPNRVHPLRGAQRLPARLPLSPDV